jgi:hypothetical protein
MTRIFTAHCPLPTAHCPLPTAHYSGGGVGLTVGPGLGFGFGTGVGIGAGLGLGFGTGVGAIVGSGCGSGAGDASGLGSGFGGGVGCATGCALRTRCTLVAKETENRPITPQTNSAATKLLNFFSILTTSLSSLAITDFNAIEIEDSELVSRASTNVPTTGVRQVVDVLQYSAVLVKNGRAICAGAVARQVWRAPSRFTRASRNLAEFSDSAYNDSRKTIRNLPDKGKM